MRAWARIHPIGSPSSSKTLGHPRRQGAACGWHGSRYEIDDCPRIVILARKDDRWLADWSLADGAITQPFDPVPGRRHGQPVPSLPSP